jgi:hypothetical protein
MGGNVFANGLEISGKAVTAQTIAAMPDVCFTPPENPATPPGVPIPYPSFGMGSDTENGTSTVKISGKTVNIKNKSDEKKTSGTEAGCAAKKGVVTSKNTGKKYFNSWSPDVKFEGEPVIRMSDLATHNHASPVGNAPPWPEITSLSVGGIDCATILAEVKMKVHAYKDADKECEPKKQADGSDNPAYQQSDHILQNACFVNSRTAANGIPTCNDYYYKNAPCVCIEDATTKTTEHGRKTQAQNEWAATQRAKPGKPNPTYKEVREANLEAMKKAKPEIADVDGKEHPAIDCLRQVCDAHFLSKMDEDSGENTQCRTPHGGAFKAQPPPTPPSTSVTIG